MDPFFHGTILGIFFFFGCIIILLRLLNLLLRIRDLVLQQADTGHDFRNLAGQAADLGLYILFFPGKVIDLIIQGIQLSLGPLLLIFLFLPLLLKIADTGSICCMRRG